MQHKGLKVEEHGLRVCNECAFMGCSVDEVVNCKCCDTRLIEIKCPHAFNGRCIKKKCCTINNGSGHRKVLEKLRECWDLVSVL